MTTVLRGLVICLVCLLALASGAARAGEQPSSGELVEVVVGLSQRPLGTTRWLAGRDAQQRTMASAQATVAHTIATTIPHAQIRWRYRLVANGMAVVVPRSQLGRLTALAGVTRVYPSVRYRTQLDRSPAQIGAPTLWGPGLETAGQGMKIAIIDEGIDQRHPFFSPAGFTMPSGYPKGQTAYTTAKVIVARAFPPARPQWKNASKPFDPELSSHGTHVAGIAAGNANTLAEGTRVSGVAPRAYLGNYKALTIPTDADVGLDGNSPELVAAIEAAVADGMDVINMSLGEPEIEPSRDIVVQALAAAAKAGVVSVVAAGNDFDQFGRGSIGSPGSAPEAITVGAVSTTRSGAADVVGSFSSSGPTPLSLQLKPEVSAPGVSIFSAAPGDSYSTLSGTSMAAPHIAGAAALLLQRHPAWTPAQVKSALALTGDCCVERRSEARGAGDVARGRRCREPAARRQSAHLCRSCHALLRPHRARLDPDPAGGPHRRRWRRRRMGCLARPAVCLRLGGGLVSIGGDGAWAAAGHRDDVQGGRRRGDGLHRPHPRRREAPHPVLVPDGHPEAREREDDTAAPSGDVLVDDEGWSLADHGLQLSAITGRPRLLGAAARPRTRLSPHAGSSGGQLRRRRHEPRQGRPCRAENRARRRRAPPDGLRRTAVQPQSLPAHLRRTGARRRNDPARRRRL